MNPAKITPELLQKYLLDGCTEEEKKIVEEWYESLQKNAESSVNPQAFDDDILMASTLQSINNQIDNEESKNKKPSINWGWIVGVAASVVTVLGFLFYQVQFSKKTEIVASHKIAIPSSELLSFKNTASKIVAYTLPDGSMVWMHKDAEIKYPEKFAADNRSVQFTGEAFFDIQKDKTRPFFIQSGEMTVRVLGTSFNVKAESETAQFRISVVTGKVEVSAPDVNSNAQQVILKPNEEALFETKTRKLSAQQLPVLAKKEIYQPLSINFTHASISHVINQLQNRFNIKIGLSDPRIANCHFNGNFENESLPVILDILCKSLEADYSIKNGLITITGEPCQ